MNNRMSLIIGVLSGKGGVGKTTLVSNLGASLAKDFNKKIIVVDGNISASHLGLHLNLYEDFKFTLKDVLDGKAPVQHAIYIHPNTGLRVLTAPLKGENVKLEKIGRVLNQLKNDYNLILVDTAPGLGREVLTVARHLDGGIIVTTPDFPAVSDALRTIKILKKIGVDILGIILNRVNEEKYELTESEVESTCEYPCALVIPEDKNVPASIAKGIPLVIEKPNSNASIAIKKLAAALMGVEYQPKNFLYRVKRFFGLVDMQIPKIVLPAPKKVKYKAIGKKEKMREELRKDIKEELKKELIRRLREKMAEKE